MSLVYAWEHLYLAMETLCGRGSQDERLVDATTQGLMNVRPEDLPAELRGEFIKLMSDLTAVEAGGDEANVRATVETLDASDRDSAVRTILIMFSAVCRHLAWY